ncbi:MAG: MBL fold metallo-hydrolase [Nocardioidaceae bacterium]
MRDEQRIRPGTGFVEIADRVWVARFEFLDVNVGLVAGARGLLMVDTNVSEAVAADVLAEVRRLGVGDVVTVVNTHHHFDHCFGNVTLAEEYAPELVCHETAAEVMLARGREVQRKAGEERPDIAATRIRVPETTFSSAKAIDLGDRAVELVHPGRGHTGGDVVVRIADVDLVFAGDLVEESAVRQGVPGFGDDSYPLEWPATLDLLLGLLTATSTVVPGHGLPVDREFVSEQGAAIGVVAETIRDLAARGVPVEDALDAASWPYPKSELAAAVRRGYAQLPPSARRLPLA